MKYIIRMFVGTLFLFVSSCEIAAKNDFELFCDFVTEVEGKEAFTKANLAINYQKLIEHIESSKNYSKELI